MSKWALLVDTPPGNEIEVRWRSAISRWSKNEELHGFPAFISWSIEATNDLFDWSSYCIADLVVNTKSSPRPDYLCVIFHTIRWCPLCATNRLSIINACPWASFAVCITFNCGNNYLVFLALLYFVSDAHLVRLTLLLKLTFTNLFFQSLSSP